MQIAGTVPPQISTHQMTKQKHQVKNAFVQGIKIP